MLSRRRFLGIGLLLSATAASLGAWRVLDIVRRRPPEPALGDAPTGTLAASTVATLVAAAQAVTGYPVEPSHYEEYYRWRAQHLRGYFALYERFAGAVDRDAIRSAGRPFVACAAAVRARILARAVRSRHPATVVDRLRVDMLDAEWPTFDRFVLGETLALFARTDAWVALGYHGWPGVPRGLDRYRRAPG
ncbi:MAG TPA: hypothetical protein VKZ50_03740 [bacterium]|nr:hypothetical protein [bacterium]